ncbi:MAG: hypothetical protein CTY31_07990 [Hyphomicrobium sp.]|nr:MAG: hypothetical protein CTY31_07990 [Hyphomicrobium sp.]
MATLALAAVGAAVGGSIFPAGLGILGATISGATLGGQLGALAGSVVDNALFGASGQNRAVEGPRLSDLQVTGSTEGAPIPRLYGRARVGGQVIWATEFDEEVIRSSQASGAGKGGALGGGGARTTEYRYYANFAVALCEGPITRIGRVWADGREIELSRLVWRLYTGTQTQEPDSLIVARDGADNVPAYRGVAYIVFERLALAEYGNRVPQLSFEVYRSTEVEDGGIRAVVMIPGSGEFVYATEPVHRSILPGVSSSENVHTLLGATDWEVAADQLQSSLPSATSVSLIVSWFGTDLRAGACELHPGVETDTKTTKPISWRVAGVSRSNAYVVSQREGRAAYGGTPSDQTVIAAIRDLNARGLGVTLTPFILMDVAEENSLANPYGGASQPPYPWRGRITCHPASGQPGTVDKTTAAASQIAAFVGTVSPAHFSISGDSVVYSGPNEWSYRRMVLHQAYLAKVAGGVEAFQIGTELRGLTQVRSGADAYPFVAALISIADDVRTILGPETKILYGADWSEYFGHQPSDGSGDVYFHLDPLWASPNIDAIGMDVYWPLSDWRDGRSHLDYQAGASSIYDLDYLKGNLHGGEGFDWYYASQADRDAQVRTPITDGAGKPWIYRFKDIKSWWLNPHYNRPGGVESATPTAWVPQSKPFWLMEIGCPAVDKGANQPNVFVDPKSSENALPYYSRGQRDDLMQARFLRAFSEAFDWESEGYVEGLNPISTLTGSRMVSRDHIFVYCWDARPYPAFPNEITYWSDGTNWPLGHWINGRLDSSGLDDLVRQILRDYDFEDFSQGALNGTVPGYVIDRVMSARDALQPLELAYFFDSIESEGQIVFRHRGQSAWPETVTEADVVESSANAALYSLTRGQETELPASAKIRFISGDDDYSQAVAEARRLTGASGRVAQADIAIVLDDGLAGAIAESWLFETWAARERSTFALPPTALAIEPGDVVTLDVGGREYTVRVTEISEHGAREIEARSIDVDVYERTGLPSRTVAPSQPVQIGAPEVAYLDVPTWSEGADATSGYVAALQQPWPGSVAVYSSAQASGYQLRALVPASATLGETLTDLSPGPEGRIDRASRLQVRLTQGALTSVDDVALLGGANLAAVRNASGGWEIFQFQSAALIAAQTYELSGLLRGQFGTEQDMADVVAAGATFIVLDAAVTPIPLSVSELGLELNWRSGPGNRDIGDASYETVPFRFTGAGLRPLSPVHVRGVRSGADDVTVKWTRRTRVGGDSWELAEVPLSEDSERYEIDILDGASVKRTLTATTPTVGYTAAQQTADFGAVQSSIALEVYQMSALGGRGTGRAATV